MDIVNRYPHKVAFYDTVLSNYFRKNDSFCVKMFVVSEYKKKPPGVLMLFCHLNNVIRKEY